jgi:hypothetical protein
MLNLYRSKSFLARRCSKWSSCFGVWNWLVSWVYWYLSLVSLVGWNKVWNRMMPL